MNAVISFLFFVIPLLTSIYIAQVSNPVASYQPLHVIDGAGLYKKELTNGNTAYLQIIDLRKMRIDQVIGEVDNMGNAQGKYYKGEGGSYSPYFKNKLFSQVNDEYKKLYGNDVFSMINCSFFEQYQPSTQLSFPIKFNGVVITGGHSPYGPVKKPESEFYRTIRLKALVWDDKQAYITDYDPASGAPLNQTAVKNAIVSYKYSDHPAKVLANNQVNKYQVIGTLNKDSRPGDEQLLIMTVNQTTLDEAAKLLRQLGVKGDIMTVDGGRSTYLFNAKVGDIILPQLSNPQENPTFRDLPHYLGVRKVGTQKVVPQILIDQPVGKVQVEQNRPYLILWRDNINGDVSIKLSDRNNKTIQNISTRTASDGVYEWTPNIAVKEGYTIRVASRENQKVFGNLQL